MKKDLPQLLFVVTILMLAIPFIVRLEHLFASYVSPDAIMSEIRRASLRQANETFTKTISLLQTEQNEIGGMVVDVSSHKNIADNTKALQESQQALMQKTALLQGELEIIKQNNADLLKKEDQKQQGNAKIYENYMPMIVSGFLGIVALILLFSRKDDNEAAKWVYGTFGAILGYWLKGGA